MTFNTLHPERRAGGRFTDLLVTGLLMGLLGAPYSALATELTPHGYRVQQAIGKFQDTTEVAVEYRHRAPEVFKAHRLEFAVGALDDGETARPFVSLGPVWRFDVPSQGYVDVGFSPTFFAGSMIGGRDLGGNFHFTSSVSVGWQFGDVGQYSLALRAQHTSNGGLHETNPGLDVVGLRFAVEFR